MREKCGEAASSRFDEAEEKRLEAASPQYCHTRLGILPSAWRIASIGAVGAVVTGNTPSTSEKEYFSGDRLFITPSDFHSGIYISTSGRTVSDEAYKVSRVNPPNSIYVVCIGATVGKVNICKEYGICNQQINAIVPNSNNNTLFLYYCVDYFFNRSKKKYIGQQTLPIVSKSQFSRIQLALPTLPEQRKIAAILATQDKVIELKTKLLEGTKRRKKALMQRLLAPMGEKRLEAASPCGEAASCRFSAEWQIVRLSDLFVPVNRKNTENNKNILTISAQDGLVSQMEYYKHQYASADTLGYTLLKEGEFAYNKSRAGEFPYGAIKMLKKYEEGVVSPIYLCFAAKNGVCKDFWSYYFNGGMVNHGLYRIAQEGARNHGLLNIPTDEFFNLELRVPPIAVQRRIVAVLSTADREIDLMEKELKALELKKKALMQLLLTGIVRVGEAASCRLERAGNEAAGSRFSTRIAKV